MDLFNLYRIIYTFLTYPMKPMNFIKRDIDIRIPQKDFQENIPILKNHNNAQND